MTCPIWPELHHAVPLPTMKAAYFWRCDGCGTFSIGLKLDTELRAGRTTWSDEARYRASWMSRAAQERGDPPPAFDFASLAFLVFPAEPDPTTEEQKGRLLRLIREKSTRPGKFVQLDAEHDWPLIGARGIAGMNILLTELVHDGLLESRSESVYDDVALTDKGWQQTED